MQLPLGQRKLTRAPSPSASRNCFHTEQVQKLLLLSKTEVSVLRFKSRHKKLDYPETSWQMSKVWVELITLENALSVSRGPGLLLRQSVMPKSPSLNYSVPSEYRDRAGHCSPGNILRPAQNTSN